MDQFLSKYWRFYELYKPRHYFQLDEYTVPAIFVNKQFCIPRRTLKHLNTKPVEYARSSCSACCRMLQNKKIEFPLIMGSNQIDI